MNDPDLTLQQRRQAIAASIAQIQAEDAALRIEQFLERSAGSPNDWDHRFLEFVRAPDAGRLLHASAGEGIEVIFSPVLGRGVWLIDQPLLRGKGFLAPHDVERLSAVVADVRPSDGGVAG